MVDDEETERTTRPLFEEWSPVFEREHPWSGPLAFVLDGMALPTRAELANQYVRAAGLLVGAIVRGDCEDYLVPNPVLYLYRRAIELRLKWLLPKAAATHDLSRLVREVSAAAATGSCPPLPGWVEHRLAEFAAVDPTSTSFRYARTPNPVTGARIAVDGEVFVDVRHLRNVMEAVDAALRRLAGYIEP